MKTQIKPIDYISGISRTLVTRLNREIREIIFEINVETGVNYTEMSNKFKKFVHLNVRFG